MKPIANLLGIALALGAGACSSRNDSSMADDEREIHYVRNSAFTGEHLRVFLTLEDGTDLSVNSTDGAFETRPAETFIPGHRAQDWTFVKDSGDGTSVAYSLVSWDEDDPSDYLMVGWWAQFHGQRYPDLSLEDGTQYAIVDGREVDPSVPPELPLGGRTTYTGQAGGLYAYIPGSDSGARVLDEYQGRITIEAAFAKATLSGHIGELVTRRAHSAFSRGRSPGCPGHRLRLRAASGRNAAQPGRPVPARRRDGAASRKDRHPFGRVLGRPGLQHC